MFDELDYWPEKLLTVPAVLIEQVLARPTLIHLPGECGEPIFVSVLLHGDEDVGLKAVQQFLIAQGTQKLPRALSIFVGNVKAASAGKRFLDDQSDYNRVWAGSEMPATPEHEMLQRVLDQMLERRVAASIDLHNNTGRNPHYGCVGSLSPEHLQLAGMFSSLALYFQRPTGVQTAAFAAHCPAITCECGPIGDATGVQAAVELLQRITVREDGCVGLALPALPEDFELYHTIATWRMQPSASVTFDSRAESDVFLRPDLDTLNFRPQAAGTQLGAVSRSLDDCFQVVDQRGQECTGNFLECDGDQLRLRQAAIPSMLTTSVEALRKDCIGYFMERLTPWSAKSMT